MDVNLSYIDPGTGFVLFSLGGWLFGLATGVLGFMALFFKRIIKFVQTHKIVIVIVGTLGLGGIFMGMFMMEGNEEGQKLDHKMVILGMDGLSPKVIEPLMREGKLPHFSRLKEEGFYGHLQTTNPPQSPVAWASFATGKNPGKTGMFDFILRDPKTYTLKLSLSQVERGKTKRVIQEKRFWEYTSEQKIPTIVIGCPLTFPPDKVFGKMLSGMGVPDIRGTEGTFSFYTTESKTQKNVGGKVFHVSPSRMMKIELEGPMTQSLGGKVKHATLPLTLVKKDSERLYVLSDQQKFELKVGTWSDWKEGVFKLGFMKKMKGIFRFYLVSVEPELNLYMSPINFDPRDPYFDISYPKEYSRELSENIGLFHTQGMPIDTWAVNEGRLEEKALLEQANTVFSERLKMFTYELSRFKGGVFFFYFGMPDTIQHMFWNQKGSYKTVIEQWYQKMDQVLGTALEYITFQDTFMVLSDHGFGPFKRAVHLNSWLRKNGYLSLMDENASSGQELLKEVDWSRTKAYAIGFGAIYMNQKGREGEGIVDKGEETKHLKQEIAQKLELWKEGDSAIVRKVYKKEDIFEGDYADQAPDLYVGFEVGYRASWQTAMGAVPENTLEDNEKKWSGDHLFDPVFVPGVLFVNKSIIKEKPSIYDIAPTVLKEMSFDNTQIESYQFDGSSLF